MQQILAFGDSNTWGLIPGTKTRYPWGTRWTSLLQDRCPHTRVIEEGLCGRTTIFEDALRQDRKGLDLLPVLLEAHAPLDGAILMLGTNDCKTYFHAPAHVIGEGIALCLDELLKVLPPEKILLVSPIFLGDRVWQPDKDPEFDHGSIQCSRQLPEVYRAIAREKGVGYLAASDHAAPSPIDEEHLSAEGHQALAQAIFEQLSARRVIHTES